MSGIERIIDFSQEPAYVRAGNGLLVVEAGAGSAEGPAPPEAAGVGGTAGRRVMSVPLAEVAAVILAHPQVTITRGALGGLAEAGAVVVICDEHWAPVSMALPLTGYHAPARRMAAQVGAGLPVRKRLWQQIIRAKIRAQAALLEQERGEDLGLRNMAEEVKSGDPENVEGQAARIYWGNLFGDVSFQRRTDAPNQNRYLNYGYAIVRAVVARAICASGLHPGMGVHHHHRENAFCLADDLMEAFRPAADELALEVLRNHGPDAPMGKAVKGRLAEVVNQRFDIEGEQRELFDAAARLAGSIAAVFEGRAERAILAEF